MLRRSSAAAVLVLLALSCRQRERPRSVVLITLDTFRADRLGPATPALARLAGESIRFAAADSPAPLTLPAHASILSGLLPLHHGLRNNGAGRFPADRETLATLFRHAGYRTGAFVGSFILDHRFGLDRGFDRYDDEIVRQAGENSGNFEAERRGGEVADHAITWLRSGGSQPSFAWIHLYDAHAPYAPPAPYPQTYDGEVAYVDAQIARILGAVDLNTTIVAVVGDHGESLGAHGELTHGLLLYEPTLHVPMILHVPSLPPRVVHTPVSTIDLAATLASLAHVSFPNGVDGQNLADDLLAGRDPQPRDLISETQYPATFGWSALSSIRHAATKLIRAPAPELYDLNGDPEETRNLVSDDRRSFRELAARLDAVEATATTSNVNAVDPETRAKLASLGYVAPTPGVQPTARDPKAAAQLFRTFEEASAALNAGRGREAIDSLEGLVRDDPSNPVFRATLARALRNSDTPGRSLALYREAVALAPNDPDAWYNLAVALEETGQTREADAALAEVERRDPSRPEIHNLRGTALAMQGALSEAEKEFRLTIAADPQNGRAMNNLGNVLRGMGRNAEAADAYRSAIRVAPRYADPRNGLGALLVTAGQPREAIAQFDAALEIAPDDYEAQLNRAIALQVAGDRSAAAGELKRLLGRLPEGKAFDVERNAARALLRNLLTPARH